jgi:hypothetical protein
LLTHREPPCIVPAMPHDSDDLLRCAACNEAKPADQLQDEVCAGGCDVRLACDIKTRFVLILGAS